MLTNKILGISLYFLGIGLWLIAVATLLVWGLPTLILMFIAGYLTHARPWPEMKKWPLWHTVRQSFFNFKVYGDEDAGQQHDRVIWAIYPHGHFSLSAVFYWALNPRYVNAKPAIHSALFYLPVIGTFARWLGAIGVTEDEMKQTLASDTHIYMCPGGVADIANVGDKIKKRRGFLRIAQEMEAVVIPVWCPDERSYYSHWLPCDNLFEGIFGFPVPMFVWGRPWCPILPRSVAESRIYIGKPIRWDEDYMEERFWEEMSNLQAKAV